MYRSFKLTDVYVTHQTDEKYVAPLQLRHIVVSDSRILLKENLADVHGLRLVFPGYVIRKNIVSSLK